jgi:hypothetical protein
VPRSGNRSAATRVSRIAVVDTGRRRARRLSTTGRTGVWFRRRRAESSHRSILLERKCGYYVTRGRFRIVCRSRTADGLRFDGAFAFSDRATDFFIVRSFLTASTTRGWPFSTALANWSPFNVGSNSISSH